MHFIPILNKNIFYSELLQPFQARRSTDGIFSTSLLGFPPLGISPSVDGIFPTRRTVSRRSADGIFLTRIDPSADGTPMMIVSVRSVDGISSLGDANADLPTGPFSISLRELKSFAVGFLPLGAPTLMQGFLPLGALFDVPLIKFFPLGNTNTSLQAPLIYPAGG